MRHIRLARKNWCNMLPHWMWWFVHPLFYHMSQFPRMTALSPFPLKSRDGAGQNIDSRWVLNVGVRGQVSVFLCNYVSEVSDNATVSVDISIFGLTVNLAPLSLCFQP